MLTNKCKYIDNLPLGVDLTFMLEVLLCEKNIYTSSAEKEKEIIKRCNEIQRKQQQQ